MNVDTPLLHMENGGTNETRTDCEEESRDNFFYLSIVYVTVYLTVGAAIYLWAIPLKNNSGSDATLIDTLYFCLTTITTVGFGDYYPRTHGGKMFTCCYILFGVGFIAYAMSYFVGKILEKQEHIIAQVVAQSSGHGHRGGSKASLKPGRRCGNLSEDETKLAVALVRLFLLMVVGVIVFDVYDNRDFFDAIYFVVVSSTTVGYGDVSPSTNVTKIFAIVWLAITTLAFAQTISSLIEYRSQTKIEKLRTKLLKQKIDKGLFASLDKDRNGSISRYEWLVYHLIKGHYPVNETDIRTIMEQFKKLDADHDGIQLSDVGL